ncbi:hypothetical protein SCA6_002321 [Theobroma cacao]
MHALDLKQKKRHTSFFIATVCASDVTRLTRSLSAADFSLCQVTDKSIFDDPGFSLNADTLNWVKGQEKIVLLSSEE